MNSQTLQVLNNSVKAEGALFISNAITQHLLDLGYKGSIRSLKICGENNNQFLVKSCGCGQKVVPLTHRCNNRACPICSQTRSRKILREFLPLLEKYSINPRDKKSLKFLTISPANYDSYENALEDTKRNLNKFLRKDYIKQRIDASMIVFEVKTKNKYGEFKGWNVHIHILYYGNKLRNERVGRCNDCGQHAINFDEFTKKPYCANKKCNSKNVIVEKDSKLVRLWNEFSTRPAIFDIRKVYSYRGACNYLAKYVSANKNDFYYEKHTAEFIHYSYGKRLFILRGEFAKYRYVKTPCYCSDCNKQISFTFDLEFIQMYLEKSQSSLPPSSKIYFSIDSEGGCSKNGC